VLTEVHCHQHAVLGWDADEKLLTAAGAQAEHLETGCCGLAGNFGFQVGHGEMSEACAERALLSRLREATPGAVVLADGFSCRTQIHELEAAAAKPCTSPSCLPRRAASTTTIPNEPPPRRPAPATPDGQGRRPGRNRRRPGRRRRGGPLGAHPRRRSQGEVAPVHQQSAAYSAGGGSGVAVILI
jgi:hypothetical protein